MTIFRDKIAIVTGGASGLGRALCEELSARGAVSIIADINMEGAQEVAAAITSNGGQASARHLDVSDAESFKKLISDVATEYGRLDYIFNNAGILIIGEVRDMSLDHWRRIIDVNFVGTLYGTTIAYALMVKQGFGHIVNISSVSGLISQPIFTAYAATKHAVVGLSTSLRGEAIGLGVKVSVVCPGLVKTRLADSSKMLGAAGEELPKPPPIGMDAHAAARKVLRGVSRNLAIIVFPFKFRILWWINRLLPAVDPIGWKTVKDFREARALAELDKLSPT
jgi:NAD(P)-dependent dehydrogenase (short-subunit alcohol dehydrogenase family)